MFGKKTTKQKIDIIGLYDHYEDSLMGDSIKDSIESLEAINIVTGTMLAYSYLNDKRYDAALIKAQNIFKLLIDVKSTNFIILEVVEKYMPIIRNLLSTIAFIKDV